MKSEEIENTEANEEQVSNTEAAAEETNSTDQTDNQSVEQPEMADGQNIEKELADWKDKYTRLFAEFDNFRKRTAKERIDLISSSTADVLKELLPVIDDFDRAVKANESTEDVNVIKEGFVLIHHKLYKKLESKGLKPINAQGQVFDTDFHEAITSIPAPSEDLKGKVVDEVEKGYLLNDKVLRFSKVVIGQ